MKKKFINGILMAALMFAATSSFVSCKDNIDDELPPIYNALAQRSSELQDKIDSLKKVIDEIEPTIINITNHYDTTINNIYNYIDTTVIKQVYYLDSSLTVVNNQINNINNQISDISLTVDSINNVLNVIDNRINVVSDSVNTLWKNVESLRKELEDFLSGNYINSVDIDATRNDVLGIINAPGIRIDGLIAYYGTNDAGIEQFPVAGYDYNVGGKKFARYLEDYELPYDGYVNFGSSDYITSGQGNAGQIYFTVNSSDYRKFDISKFTKITIENSAGEVAPVQISNVRRSSARVGWDFGKAFLEETGKFTDNGFYVADATIDESDLDATRFGIEKFIDLRKLRNELKDRMKDVRDGEGENGSTAANPTFKNFIRECAGLVFGLFKNDLTAYDRATNPSYSPQRMAFFMEKDGELVRKGQSKLELFTSAVKPLSYNTFWEYENSKESNWIIEDALERAIARVAREIDNRWGESIALKAKIVSVNDAEETVTIQLNGNIETIVVSNAQYMQDLRDAIRVNGGLDAVNDKLSKLLKSYTLGKATTKAADRINTFLDKFSDQLTIWIKKHLFTRAVAPIIIFETSNGMDRLCEGMKINRGTMHAYLTSGTMELLAPAYKKYVALVKSGQLLQSEVLPGNTLSYDYDLNEPGDYTVILSCVDYFGFVITKKYDIHVK
jgi:hypothetical protein